MVRPPYWVAARIFAAAATRTGKARISGSYTLNTGRDIEELPPHLYLNVVESWLWDHFNTRAQADEWLRDLDVFPVLLFGAEDRPDFAAGACFLRSAILAGERLAVMAAGGNATVEDVPPGWDSAVLLSHSKMIGTLIE